MEINYTLSPYTRWLDKIDNSMWKPDKRDLIVLFGYMSSWKTEFTYWMARKNIDNEIKVCYISLELPEYDMKLRIARKVAWIKRIDFQNGRYSDHQKSIMEWMFRQLEEMEELRIVKPDQCDMTTIMRTMRLAYDEWCRLFVVDNLDKIIGDANDNTRYQKISSYLQDFKNENNCCVILIHHAKKPMDKAQTYTPAWMWGMRWSQKIMDNATQVIEIRRDLDPDIEESEKSKVTLFQYKNTFEGNNWFVELYFHKWEYHEQTYQTQTRQVQEDTRPF